MIDIGKYFNDTKQQLIKIIEERKNSKNRNENSLQEFFQNYPLHLLPVLSKYSISAIFGNIVISQLRLKSFDGDRQPDFLIVTWNSLNLFFNFIELEDPSKKIFEIKKQQPSGDFFKAYNQLMQWSSFKSEVALYCNELLRSLYKDNFNNTVEKVKHYNYILLYGFSDEVIGLGERFNHILQEYFKEPHMQHCTFSRLLSNFKPQRPLFTVQKDPTTNKFKAIGFAPFKKYRIDLWSDFHNIIGKQDLIKKTDYLTKEEIENLILQIDELDSKNLKEIITINKSDLSNSLVDEDYFYY